MTNLRTLLSCPLLVALTCIPGMAQESRAIAVGESISGNLEGDSNHRYTLELSDGTFVYGEVDQISVDVVVTVFDAEGVQVRAFDSPSRGPEHFQFETESAGRFVIEVTPFEEGEGDYAIQVLKVEPVATDPAGRVDQMMIPFSGDNTPGVVVGVVQDGALRFARAYGMANLDHGVPFDVGTISNIGSVTKQFTAMGLLLLQADGKLSIEDDIREHIPELPDFGPMVTIRNLLNHTSGYREVYNLMPLTGFQGEDALRRDHVIEIVRRQPELQAPPNTEFNYNNTGFILLATTIERVSGMTYPEYMKERVFGPLGMVDTRVKAYQGEIIPGSALGYVPVESRRGFRSTRDLAASYGAGGIYTTVGDLTRWMLNYRDVTLGGEEAIKAITTKPVLADGDTSSYGLGLGIGEMRGRTLYSHTGGDVAHRAYFSYYPELQSGVILMSNNGSFDPGMGGRIATVFFEDRFEPEVDETDEAGPGVEGGGMSSERLEAIKGTWVIDVQGVQLDIVYSLEEGQLYAQATGQPRFRVNSTSDSTVAFEGVSVTNTFHFEADGSLERATLHQGGGDRPMKRIERVDLTAEDLAEFAGRYYSEEIETLYELKVEEGVLTLHSMRLAPFPLSHRQGDEFSSSQFFLSTLSFRRAGNGRITGFEASNGRTKGVWFKKQ
jgi:CubicO group peptidase (beta-lactamase class C family)